MSDTDTKPVELIKTGDNSGEGEEKKMSDYTGQEQQKEHYYGEALNDNNVNDLVDDTVPHVVILVGFPKYGKSTFVSSFYHAVMKNGKIGKYKFVDSETLLGFERRAYIRREELRVKKRLNRTPISGSWKRRSSTGRRATSDTRRRRRGKSCARCSRSAWATWRSAGAG